MRETLSHTWPFWVAGPLIGLVIPALLLIGNRQFGLSSNFRHLCAMIAPGKSEFLRYDWKRTGLWNLTFALGMLIGGFIASHYFANPDPVIGISDATKADLAALGITNFQGLLPRQVFSFETLFSLPGLILIIGGGFLVGFGARYAGGCTSGHAIMGIADLQLPSLVAAIGFFVGGVLVTHFALPLIF
jgi:hypothetical protein